MTRILIGLAYACLLASGGVMFWMNAQGGRLHQMLAINTAAAARTSDDTPTQAVRDSVPTPRMRATQGADTHMMAKPVMLDSSQSALLEPTRRPPRSSAAARGATLP